MVKFFGLVSLILSGLAFAGADPIPVLTCKGQLKSDTYGLKVVAVVGFTDETSGSLLATLRKNGKLSKVSPVIAFNNGINMDFGYRNMKRGLKVSIPHVQLTDILFPYARGTLHVFGRDAWLKVQVMCNVRP